MNTAFAIALLRAKFVAHKCFKRAVAVLVTAGLDAVKAHREVLSILRGFRTA